MTAKRDGDSRTSRRRAGLLLALLLLLAWPRAPEAGDRLAPPGWEPAQAERAVVAAVLEAGVLRLEDGRRLVPAALRIPRFGSRALSEALDEHLAALVQGRGVHFDRAAPTDRHGRFEAQIVTAEGLWLQAELVGRGLARVSVGPQPQALLDPLLEEEARARGAGLGLWGEPAYRLLPAAAVPASRIGRFQVIEGRVLDGALVRGRGYLNFGADWREDFTVVIPPRQRRAFAAAGRSVEELEGRRVRVRGWLDDFNGPMIEVRYPSQIELLDE